MQAEHAQTIDHNECLSNQKNPDNNRIVQAQASKSACTTARGPGPTVASGPLNPIGQKQVAYNFDQRMSSSNQRPSQMRQSASGLAQKVTRTSSRKSIGFQSNLTSIANSKKQLETAKGASLRGNLTGTVDDKTYACPKTQPQKASRTGCQNVRNSAANYKSPLVQTNTTSFGSQRGKQVTYSANQNE